MRQRIVTAHRLSAWLRQPEFWLVCLLFWLLMSACRSLGTPWARAALTECLRWGIGIALALALSATLQRTTVAARFLLCTAGALSVAGIWDGLRTGGGGLVGPYQDHQLYGSALMVLLPNALSLALTSRDLRWRLGAQAITAALLLCLLLSETRSAWAGAIVSCIVFGGFWVRGSQPGRSRWKTAVICAAVLLAGAVSVWTVTAPSDMRSPLALRTATLTTLRTDHSWQARLSTWHGAARMAASQPIAGYGLGRYPTLQWRWTHNGSPLSPSDRPSLSEEAHNLYLQTAAETGLIGLGLYGIALLTSVCSGFRRSGRAGRIHRPGSRDAQVMAFISMVVGQSVDAIGSPSWQFGEVSLLFWAALGVGLAAMRKHEAETALAPLPIPLPLRRAGQMAFGGAAVLLLSAQVLPLGLLTPVEAYNTPTSDGYLFNYTSPGEMSYTPTSLTSSGGTITFTLLAHFKDPNHNNAPHNVDVTFDGSSPSPSGMTVFTVSGNHTLHSTAFSTNAATRNQLTVDPNDVGFTLTVLGKFYINGAQQSVVTSFVPHPAN